MDLPFRPNTVPPFHQLDEYDFQGFCRDLALKRPGVAFAQVHGPRWQRQYGVDVLEIERSDASLVLFSCKRYRRFTGQDIETACAEFLDNWQHWSERLVRQFILFVACELNFPAQSEVIQQQSSTFLARGVEFELWDAIRIREELAPHRDIAARWLGRDSAWIEAICGPRVDQTVFSSRPPSHAAFIALSAEREVLANELATSVGQGLSHALDLFRQGAAEDADQWVRDVEGNEVIWSALPDAARVDILVLKAQIALDAFGDMSRARAAIEGAGQAPLSPAPRLTVLSARLALLEGDTDAALQILRDQKTVHSLLQLALIHLTIGQPAAAKDAADRAWGIAPTDPEILRVQALVALAMGEIAQAQVLIRRALDQNPTWRLTRITAGIIGYFGSIAPAAVPRQMVAFPEPVRWELVRRDDESESNLRAAASSLNRLLVESGLYQDERRSLQAFRLACLANDPERQEEATSYCEELIRQDPAHVAAIAWGIGRSYAVDFIASENKLRALVRSGHVSLEQVMALVNIQMATGRPSEALKTLTRTRSRFTSEHASEIWLRMRVQGLLMGGAVSKAKKLVDRSSSDSPLVAEARLMVVTAQQPVGGQAPQLVEVVDQAYRDTGDPLFLYHKCELLAHQQDWAALADASEGLVTQIGTPDAIRLAAIGLLNSGKAAECLQLLAGQGTAFPRGELPQDLRLLRIQCHRALGSLNEVIGEVAELVRSHGASSGVLTLVPALIDLGETAALRTLAAAALEFPDADPSQLLALSAALANDDSELAAALWRRAAHKGISDDLVGAALFLSYRLGLEAEARSMSERMTALADRGSHGFGKVSFEDLVAMIRQQSDVVSEADRLYRTGQIFFHLLAGSFHRSLAWFLHTLAFSNESVPDPKNLFPLLIRHGGRAMLPKLQRLASETRLTLDITALLVAHHLGILRDVEAAFSAIRVPEATIPFLRTMREQATHHQPSKLAADRQIARLVEVGRLHIAQPPLGSQHPLAQSSDLPDDWFDLHDAARDAGGYLVDYLPLRNRNHSGPAKKIPVEVAERVVNCAAVIEELHLQGALDRQQLDSARARLGTEGRAVPGCARPIFTRPVFLRAGVANLLAESGALSPLSELCVVQLDPNEWSSVQGTLNEEQKNEELRAWIEQLIQQVAIGLQRRRWSFVARKSPPDVDAEEPHDLALDTLRDIVEADVVNEDLVWADDRYLSSFLFAGGAPLAGVTEILGMLEDCGTIDRARQFVLLRKLRSANARFIPVSGDELAAYLADAPVVDGRLVETDALANTRRYIAACLSEQACLIPRDPMSTGLRASGEVPLLFQVTAAVADALVSIWKKPGDSLSAQARSDWLIEGMWVNHVGARRAAELREETQDDAFLAAASLLQLVRVAFLLPTEDASGTRSLRQAYLEWLDGRLLRRQTRADSQIAELISDQMKTGIVSALDSEVDPVLRGAATIFARQLLEDLPPALRDELANDQTSLTSMGMHVVTLAGVGPFLVDEADLWRATAEALQSGHSTSPVHNSRKVLAFEAGSGGSHVKIYDSATGDEALFADPRFSLLKHSFSERVEAIRSFRSWFDQSNPDFDLVVERLAAIDNAWLRIREFNRLVKQSPSRIYESLESRLSERKPVGWEELSPPPSDAIERYLRLSDMEADNTGFSKSLEDAASNLLAELGLDEAVRRVCGLPVPLPESLCDAIQLLDSAEKRALIKRLLVHTSSPVATLHLVRILALCRGELRGATRLSRKLLRRWLVEEGQLEAFALTLRWIEAEIGNRADAASADKNKSVLQLVSLWVHANRVFGAFRAAGLTESGLQDRLASRMAQLPRSVFTRPAELDVASPTWFSIAPFALTGLAYAAAEVADETMIQGVGDALFRRAVLGKDGSHDAARQLLADPRNKSNHLGSFLALDRGLCLRALLQFDHSEDFSGGSIDRLIANAVDNLAADQGWEQAWAQLTLVLGESPPAGEMRQKLSSALKSTRYVDLFARDPDLGLRLLVLATRQVSHIDDPPAADYLESQVDAVARVAAEADRGRGSVEHTPDGPASERWDLIVEAVLNLSVAQSRSPAHAAERFATMMRQLLGIWPSGGDRLRPSIQAWCELLPVSQAEFLWPLLLDLRSAVPSGVSLS